MQRLIPALIFGALCSLFTIPDADASGRRSRGGCANGSCSAGFSETSCAGGQCMAPSATAGNEATTKPAQESDDGEPQEALAEVNAYRARLGLPAFVYDEALTRAALGCARFRARYRIEGHTSNDFAALPPGAHADATGCAAWEVGTGWGSCCSRDSYRYAGAAYAIRGRTRFMHLVVSHTPNATSKAETAPKPKETPKTQPKDEQASQAPGGVYVSAADWARLNASVAALSARIDRLERAKAIGSSEEQEACACGCQEPCRCKDCLVIKMK